MKYDLFPLYFHLIRQSIMFIVLISGVTIVLIQYCRKWKRLKSDDRNSKHRKALRVEIIEVSVLLAALIMASAIRIGQAIQYVSNPEPQEVVCEYVASKRTHWRSMFNSTWSFKRDDDSLSLYVDMLIKNKLYPGPLEKGESYFVVFDNNSKIILYIEKSNG